MTHVSASILPSISKIGKEVMEYFLLHFPSTICDRLEKILNQFFCLLIWFENITILFKYYKESGNLEFDFYFEKHFIKFVLICCRIVPGKYDKKYSTTYLPIFNIEGGIKTETWVQ